MGEKELNSKKKKKITEQKCNKLNPALLTE